MPSFAKIFVDEFRHFFNVERLDSYEFMVGHVEVCFRSNRINDRNVNKNKAMALKENHMIVVTPLLEISNFHHFHAFKMYDFDGDSKIGRNDVAEIIRRLTGIEDDVTKLARGTADLDVNQKRVGVTERKSKPIQTYDHYDKADKGFFKHQNLKNDFFDVSRFIEDTVNAVMREAGKISDSSIEFKDFQKILVRNPDFRSHFTFKILDDQS